MPSVISRNNVFYVVYRAKDEKNNSKQIWESGFADEQEANLRCAELALQKLKGGLKIPKYVTVKEFMETYVKLHGGSKWKFKTHDTNISLIKNHILPELGDTMLKDLKPMRVEEFIVGLREKPTHLNNKYRKQGPPLSAKTRRNIFDVLFNALEYAVYPMKLIEENPLPKKSRPSIDIPDKEIWTVDDFRQALEDLPSSLLHLGIHFAYASSCRPGEMLALTEDCIDLAKGKVHLNKTIQRVCWKL